MNTIPYANNIDCKSQYISPKIDQYPQPLSLLKMLIEIFPNNPLKSIPKEFDYRLIQSKTQNLNSSSQAQSRLRSDTPITIRGSNYRYVGQMNGNQREGVGSYFTNELEYEGEWLQNVYNGFGKYYLDGKLSYQGQFKDGLKHGAGIEYYDADSYFVGNFQNNKKNGIGTLYRIKEKIQGMWENDQLVEKY
ncbi:unnamed protein product [Paramecium sonneborni]|uniref:MORN repeat protein n=1 Tax=Paramecium sonneborni TaxID=65129 RepID=A0A8S1N657_9CILI|nr:unnamed protein product [Paramecium sonneborni]